MRYIIQQKFFTVRDKYYIQDENNQARFMIQGNFAVIRKKFKLCTVDGREIFYIKQRAFRIFKRFDFYQNGQYVGKFKQKFAFFTKKAKISSDFGDYKVKGNIFAWDFHVKQDGNDHMTISKKILRIADTYTVDIARGANEAFLLGNAIIIDALFQPKR